MNHRATPSFWVAYEALPRDLQDCATEAFQRLKADLRHPSLRLKRAGSFWSVRVDRGCRALGVDVDGGILGISIGSHDAYQRLLDAPRPIY